MNTLIIISIALICFERLNQERGQFKLLRKPAGGLDEVYDSKIAKTKSLN